MALQPCYKSHGYSRYLQQQKLLWPYSPSLWITLIILYLQQQKLLWPYSRKGGGGHVRFRIYNSRNCYGLIARAVIALKCLIYNSRNCYGLIAQAAHIVNIYLQQQKLLWPYSRYVYFRHSTAIYNSRNCYGLIAIEGDNYVNHEIYNSRNCYGLIALSVYSSSVFRYLQQQKLLWPYSQWVFFVAYNFIYNSRNCYGLIASAIILRLVFNLQQQKLLWPYSQQHGLTH